MKYLIIPIILLSILSCKKERIKIKEHEKLIGTFEWYYSFNDFNESESIETVDDKYALVFKKNEKIEVYKNAKLVDKGYVSDVWDYSLESDFVSCYLFEAKAYLSLYDDYLEYESYPISGHINRYKKI
jgi:hypothetical protein